VLGAGAMGGSMYLKRGGQKNQPLAVASDREPPVGAGKPSPSLELKAPADPKPRRTIKIQ